MPSALNRNLHHLASNTAEVLARLSQLVPVSKSEVVVHKNLRYAKGHGRAHLLDVYVPQGKPGPHPVLFYVHGGGFAMLSKETHRFFGITFARRGYVVVNINYRLGRKNAFPLPLKDAAQALVWTRKHAATYGGDLSRLVLAGESAGANLVLALTLATVFRPKALAGLGVKPIAVLPLYGMLELSNLHRLYKPHMPRHIWAQLMHAAEAYLGDDFLERGKRVPWASPLLLLEAKKNGRGIPPMFTCVGTRDPLLSDSRRLHAALTRLKVAGELVIAPGEIHAYNVFTWRPAARHAWERLFAFLERTVPRVGAPTQATARKRR